MTAGLVAAGAPVSIPPLSHSGLPGLASHPHQTHSALRAFALTLPPPGMCPASSIFPQISHLTTSERISLSLYLPCSILEDSASPFH